MGKAVCLSFDHKAKSLAPRLKVLRLFVSSPEAFISSLTFPLLMGVEGTAGEGVGVLAGGQILWPHQPLSLV